MNEEVNEIIQRWVSRLYSNDVAQNMITPVWYVIFEPVLINLLLDWKQELKFAKWLLNLHMNPLVILQFMFGIIIVNN